ncbi:MAG: family 78 glycoside hydrolase catalytic domain [Eubacteriales bacterium]|nr:family 78 glycoside hydrolase catalytic domain [Eubacteriales bacterium]MDD3883002.1 family 78 glycoside hydrolase catalytic domain [Eubacteriales bacterium]MDD4513450.1 family 78 glycoside hydrolase catalytic domain [Eubacteriales bacterium]
MEMTFITPSKPIRFPKLWKNFSAKDVRSANLDITGLGLYRATLNGKRVGADYLTPGFNDYDAYLRYQSYDVTPLLKARNRLEITLGDGWYMGRFGLDGGREKQWGDRCLLAARLTIACADGSEQIIETDESWLASQSFIVSGNIYDGEIRDDTRDEGKSVKCRIAKPHYALEKQFSPPIRQVAALSPTIITTPKGETVLDFEQNAAGIIRFVNRLPKGSTMRIQTGEVLQEGCFYRDNLRSAKSEYVYTSDGLEKTVEPLFTFYGFRYAKIESPLPVNPEDFTFIVLSSDLRNTLQCETDNDGLNRLMHNSLWGQRSNFLDVPTDCPQRDERLGWTADTQVFVNTACYQMDCKDFYRKYMRDLRADQTMYYEGDIPMYSPSLQHAAGNGGAVWADAGTIIPWNVYMNYGDKALLRENYPMMRDYTETLIAADEKYGGTHLTFNSFTFGDWLAQDGMTPQSLKGSTEDAYIQGVYYRHSVLLTSKAAAELGISDDAERYNALGEEIKKALLDEYVTPNGRLSVDTQTGYVLALHYGIYRDRASMEACFRKRLERDFYRITCGFTGAPLMLPVLLDCGMTDIAYRMLLSRDFPGWLYAVDLGATTIWERWNSLEKDGTISGTGMNSLNHYAYGSVCEAVYSRIMGLQNASAGWKRARIAPKLSGRIRHSSICFDSPAGQYAVTWSIEDDGSVFLRAEVPLGASAEIVLPDHPENKRETVEAGTYEYHYRPTINYLHPFSSQSLLMDLMDNEQTAEILGLRTPALYGMVTDKSSEFLVMSPVAASYAMPFLNPKDAVALDSLLRAVKLTKA